MVSLAALWISTIRYIVKNNKKEKQYLKLEEKVIEGIANTYIDNSTQETENLITLKSHIKNNDINFWDSASVFIKVNRVIKFSKNQNFKFIFNSLGLEKILQEKILQDDWYVKAKAIWMTYEFGITDNTKLIIPYRDDENTLVRRESQIALVTFLGWRSLIFLPYVTRPMSLWQQIRIIEKLNETEGELDTYHFEKALQSENVIVKGLLIRIIKNFKLQEYKYYIEAQLNSNNTNLIEVAVEALADLTLKKTGLKKKKEKLFELQPELVKNFSNVN